MEAETVLLPLTQGKFAIIDKIDEVRCFEHNWQYVNKGGKEYVGTNVAGVPGKRFYLHRFLLDFPIGLSIDHINGNGLDNRQINLRACTHQQNRMNSKVADFEKSSIYKGVYWKDRAKPWVAQIRVNYKRIYLGHHTLEIDAAKAYDIAALKYFGEFARLNFPKGESNATSISIICNS